MVSTDYMCDIKEYLQRTTRELIHLVRIMVAMYGLFLRKQAEGRQGRGVGQNDLHGIGLVGKTSDPATVAKQIPVSVDILSLTNYFVIQSYGVLDERFNIARRSDLCARSS